MSMRSNLSKIEVNQGILIDKIIAFGIINNIIKPNDSKKINLLMKGLCFGFSVCHSAMASIGKLNWWQAALLAISEWDGKKGSLANRVILPDTNNNIEDKSGATWKLSQNTLEVLIEKILLNYVLINFGDRSRYQFFNSSTNDTPTSDMFSLDIEQENFLNPNAQNGFEMLAPDNEVLKIKDTISSMVKIDKVEELLAIDDPAAIQLRLISSENHICSWRIENHIWFLYDPNYPEGEKSFSDSKLFIKEVKERLLEKEDDYLCINVAALKNEINLKIKQKLLEASMEFNTITESTKLSGNHLRRIIKYSPKALQISLELAKNNVGFRKSFVTALTEQRRNGNTALHILLHYYPNKNLLLFLKLAELDPDVSDVFLESLPKKSDEGFSILHSILHKAQHALPRIINLAAKSAKGKLYFLEALADTDNQNNTTLHKIVTFGPKLLPILFASFDEVDANHHGILNFAKTFLIQNATQNTSLHLLLKKAPDFLPNLLGLIVKYPQMQTIFFSALKIPGREGDTLLNQIFTLKLECFAQIAQLANDNTSLRPEFIEAFYKIQNGNNPTPLITAVLEKIQPENLEGLLQQFPFFNQLLTNYPTGNKLIDDLIKNTYSSSKVSISSESSATTSLNEVEVVKTNHTSNKI